MKLKKNKIKEQTSLSFGHLPLKKGEALKKMLGFTLVELLVVISIISILTIVTSASFVESQKKSRDSARKANLKALSTALNQYYADKGYFPCGVGTTCINGLILTGGELKDGGIIYMKALPNEKVSGVSRFFYDVSSTTPIKKSFRVFVGLENAKDKDCLSKTLCSSLGYPVATDCCYVITSSNIGATSSKSSWP